MSGPRCSIVIPVHDRPDLTKRCLDTLEAQELGDTELVVVDDGSGRPTQRLLQDFADRVRTVRHEAARGFAGACNAGFAAAGGREVVFLNNDTIPRPDWLAHLQAEADAHPEAAAIGARLLYPDGTVQHAGVCIPAEKLPKLVYRGLPGEHPAVCRSRELQAVIAACVLVRRGPFAALGGFDEAFVNGYEDTDLCLRLGAAGHTIRYCGASVVTHLESPTRGTETADLNRTLYLSRWAGARSDEAALYVEDGLITLEQEPNAVRVLVDPIIGAPAVEQDALAAHLIRQAQRMLDLQNTLGERFRAERLQPRIAFAHAPDGSLVPLELPGQVRAAEDRDLRGVTAVRQRLEPLRLDVDPAEPPRVTLLVDALDPGAGSGLTVLQLAAALLPRRAVRILCTEGRAPERAALRAVRGVDGLADLTRLELAERSATGQPLVVGTDERWVATSWTTAHLAGAAGRGTFAYLIADDETEALPSGSFAALAAAAYALPHRALFTSPTLRDAFAERRLGVFAPGAGGQGLTLPRPLADLGPVTATGLDRPGARRVLFDARPGALDARHLFELGLLALERAMDAFAGEWRFTAVGLPAGLEPIPLPGGRVLEPLPRQPTVNYRALLRGHDVGLAPLLSADPGRVALEMAAAGLSTVTTQHATKTAEAVAALSPNLRAVAPDVDALAEGLAWAAGRTEALAERAAGTAVAWSRSHAETFTPARVDELLALVDER